MAKVLTHRDLVVHKNALDVAHTCAELASRFPFFESSLKDQLRRASRSPGACIAEAWRKRRYPGYWVNKLCDAMAEAGETQWWLEVSYREGYCSQAQFEAALDASEKLIAQLAKMVHKKEKWTSTN